MPRIFPIIKKVITSGFASATTVVQLRPAPSLAAVVTGTPAVAPISPAVGITPTPVAAVVPVTPAEGLTSSVEGSVSAPIAPAPALSSVLALQPAPISEGVQQTVFITLNGTYGAESATNTTEAGSAWSNTGNAVGAHNGTLASHPGNALSAQTARLAFQFPSFPNKTGLTITAVKLRFYARQAGTVLGNGGLQFYRGTAAVPNQTLIVTETGNVDYLTTPYEVDLFALGITTWAQLDDLAATIRGNLAAGAALVTQDADAVELLVTATA
jgi:hypothetical protein